MKDNSSQPRCCRVSLCKYFEFLAKLVYWNFCILNSESLVYFTKVKVSSVRWNTNIFWCLDSPLMFAHQGARLSIHPSI